MNAFRLQVLIVAAVFVWSGIDPYQREVWFLETLPVLVGGGLMVACWRRFPWTLLAATLTSVFALILCVGGHYTYALVPLGDWMAHALDLSRNHYDRLGHLFQGITPAILGREMLLRCTPLRPGKALFWVVVAIALAISAAYEIVEWWTAVIADPEAGTAFLGSQGDTWDAQWDMFLAMSGAILVQLLLGRLHDRQLSALEAR